MPQISVIVPVYKVEPYIHRCVDSILAQTFTDFELILVDDGSPDTCPAICDEYAQKDPRVRVIHQTNQGQSVARNRAVSEALADWISFVDSDDVIHPQMLELLYQPVKESGVDISMCGTLRSADLPDTFLHPVTPAFDVSVVDESYHVSLYTTKFYYWIACSKLIRKQIVEKIPFTPGRVFEDNAVVGRYFGEAHLAAKTETPLYFYQINPNSTFMSLSSHKKLNLLWALEELIHFYQSVHYEKMLQKMLTNYLMTSAQLYHEIKEGSSDAQTEDIIKHRMKQCMEENRRYINLSLEERIYVWGLWHPHIAAICLHSRAVFMTIKQGGVGAMFKKAKAKISKRTGSGT